jgi:hypothetical protein
MEFDHRRGRLRAVAHDSADRCCLRSSGRPSA